MLMLLHSTGNGDINEISDTVKKNVQIPGRFITYDVDRKMASFRPNGGCISIMETAYFIITFSVTRLRYLLTLHSTSN